MASEEIKCQARLPAHGNDTLWILSLTNCVTRAETRRDGIGVCLTKLGCRGRDYWITERYVKPLGKDSPGGSKSSPLCCARQGSDARTGS